MIEIILLICGGMGIFLFGLNTMRDALLSLSNERVKNIISKSTKSIIKSFLIGFVLTILIQSSSGITALAIMFATTNIISFKACTAIILGANLGTTSTAFLFSLDVGKFALFIIFIGIILCFFKKETIKKVGAFLAGFGLLFHGLMLVDDGLLGLASLLDIETFLRNNSYANNPLLGLLFGTIISAILQSSSATIAIVQNLYSSHVVSLSFGLGLMLGANIGTTIGSLIPAIGTNKTAKYAVYFNIIFNFGGAVLFLLLLRPFCNILMVTENLKLQIAYGHLLFNAISCIVIMLFLNKIDKYFLNRINA